MKSTHELRLGRKSGIGWQWGSFPHLLLGVDVIWCDVFLSRCGRRPARYRIAYMKFMAFMAFMASHRTHLQNAKDPVLGGTPYKYIYIHINTILISHLWLIANIYVWPLFLVLVHTTFDLQENFLQNSAQLVQQMPRSSRSSVAIPAGLVSAKGRPGGFKRPKGFPKHPRHRFPSPKKVPIESYRCPIVIPKDPQISHRTTRNHRKTHPKKWKCLTGQLMNWYEYR